MRFTSLIKSGFFCSTESCSDPYATTSCKIWHHPKISEMIRWYSCDNQNSVWFLLRILIIMQLFCFHVIRRFQKKYESLIDTSRFISTLWMVVHSFPGRTFALTLSIMKTSCIPELTFTNIFYVSGPCQYNISAFKNLTQQTNGFR